MTTGTPTLDRPLQKRRVVIRPDWFAYGAAVAFAVGLSRFAVRALPIGDGTPVGAVLGIVEHLLLLVGVVWALPAPRWAKAAGAGWLLVDMTTDLLAVGGASSATYLTVRFLGHLLAAVWIFGAARRGDGAFRWVGVVLAVLLAGYTLVALWVPPVALAPTGPLLVAFWWLAGRRLASSSLPALAR